MKFAHTFTETLNSQGFPPYWVSQAIPYHQLKKSLRKLGNELKDLGLDARTLRYLLDPGNDSPLTLEYQLNPSSTSNLLRPELTAFLHLPKGKFMNTSLTPETETIFRKITADVEFQQLHTNLFSSSMEDLAPAIGQSLVKTVQNPDDELQTIRYPLNLGQEFFDILQTDVQRLEDLQRGELKSMSRDVVTLGQEIAQVAKPSRFSKKDLAAWRDIFERYLDAEVFFSTREMSHGARSAASALKQLQWFQGEVEKKRLANAFKFRESQRAYDRFLCLNTSLLKNLQFQELNKTAVYKILKKFDKTTSFDLSHSFPNAIKADRLLAGSVAKEVCAQMSRELVSLVPQINDHLCPICLAVAWRPIRLDCQHVFCIRCVIQMQRREERFCPLCRAEVVLQASEDNIDRRLERYLRKYFAREVKEKHRANEIERGIEDFGSSYKHTECSVM